MLGALMVQSHGQSLHLAAVRCAEARRAVAWGCKASVSLPLHSPAKPPSLHTSRPVTVSVKEKKKKDTQCFYYTCNFPVLYFERKLF